MRIKNKIGFITASILISGILFTGCSSTNADDIRAKKLTDTNTSFYMKVDDISFTKDVKTDDTDTLVQGTITKGQVNVGDNIKIATPKKDFEGKVAIIRIDKGNKDLQTGKVGEEVQVIIDGYTGGNQALCLYK